MISMKEMGRMDMNQVRQTVTVKGKEIGAEKPLICVPLVGKSDQDIMNELKKILEKAPDLIEWRADHYVDLSDTNKVLHILEKIADLTKEIPIIFTIRSTKEGGEEISLSEREKLDLLDQVSASGAIDLFDYELVNENEDIQYVLSVAKKHNVKLILSYHNFESTPDMETMLSKCREAQEWGADIAKVSVMPTNMNDVLLLLQATEAANQEVNIPLITISMGSYGSITRMSGWLFGSAVTFAIGEQSSAPGQVPIEDLKEILYLMKKSM